MKAECGQNDFTLLSITKQKTHKFGDTYELNIGIIISWLKWNYLKDGCTEYLGKRVNNICHGITASIVKVKLKLDLLE